jgi:hypothetical protein
VLGQEPIKVVREFLFVPLTISARTAAHLYAARSHGVHEISHIEFRADVFRGVQFAARTQGVTAFFDDLGASKPRGTWRVLMFFDAGTLKG